MSTHRARKRFGQNFLHDPAVIARIVRVVAPQAGQHLVEIGPGQAAITQPLLASGCQVTAIEIDRDLASMLRQKFADERRFSLIEQDVLKVDLASLQPQPIRIVGNLPYNISTPVLFKVLACPNLTDAHVMLQREVVDRMVAKAGEPAYGRLSVMLAAVASSQRVIDVGPGAFKPAPKVQSAVARITPLPQPLDVGDSALFADMVRAAFAARRKTLSNALKSIASAAEISAAGIDPGARAEVVSPAQYATLAKRVAARASPHA